jgi:serine/threonine-protein kinase RsbW
MVDLQRHITGAGDLTDLPRIMQFVDSVFSEAEVDAAAWFDLELAIEEACANVIEHAYEGEGGAYRLTLTVRGSDLIITLVDHGTSFNPAEITAPELDLPLDERPIGGLGLHLMKLLMDEVSFSFGDEGNVLRMTKRNVIGRRPDV